MATKVWDGTDTGNEGDVSVAANWDPSGVPITGDNVYLKDSSQSMTDGLDAMAAVVLASLHQHQSFTGLIGDEDNPLEVGFTLGYFGEHTGPNMPAGSGSMYIDAKTAATSIVVYNTGTPSTQYKPALNILAVNASNTLVVYKGDVGVALGVGEVSTFSSITVVYADRVEYDAKVYIGSGVTLTTLVKHGGVCTIACSATTITNNAGTTTTEGTAAYTTIIATGGLIESNASGLVGTARASNTGVIDFLQSPILRTVTNAELDFGGSMKMDPSVVTLTNDIVVIATSGKAAISVTRQ
jgi:hypothetical protein